MKKVLIKLIVALIILLTAALNFSLLNADSGVYATGKTGMNEPLFTSEEYITARLGEDAVPWGAARIGVKTAHQQNKGKGVRVAVLDTGIDLDHPDLAVAGNVTFISGTSDGDDDNGHGTLVAGIIASLDNNLAWIGVAPEVELYAVKVLNHEGKGALSSIVSGIRWAIKNDMQVINMSFGDPNDMPSSVIKALEEACDSGIVIVTGAGNGGNIEGEGDNIWAPARYESVIAVGAVNKEDGRCRSSSTGESLELVAPGINIPSTAMGGGYSYLTGTSAAAPHVTGVVALLIASGMADNEEIRQWLLINAVDIGDPDRDDQFGYGMVSAVAIINHIY